ncbi:MAG: hypothetical protein DI564_14100 [Rhodanobacter denitrificans]|uniref:Transmembrane protein n=1 Tax=Rhodanobacter denitrificans TaxID=666685 RepID=A0A2W5LXL2_9GAMM|nr:MAG: hypothetical protein DI564_14100 [Rhodanobacter denitrificans]
MRAIPIVPRFAAFALALGLALAVWRWHIPLMLWDHLDLVPIYRAWQDGALSQSEFWRFHGGHLHSAAYAVLLVTTALSGGQPWLDCMVSLALLLAYAALVLSIARDSLAAVAPRTGWLVVGFALYPGHLANLQWGWQVAVFLCLLGVVVAIRALSAGSLTWRRQAIALAGAAVAYASFATAIALIPAALTLIALRGELSPRQRLVQAIPWLVAAAAVAMQYRLAGPAGGSGAAPGVAVHYLLNFLGAGIARFATDLAPLAGAAGLVSGVVAMLRTRNRRASLPWCGLFVFGLVAAALAAAGRAGDYGADQAFSSRYVSFSSIFWLGWAGLVALAEPLRDAVPRRFGAIAWGAVAVLAAINAVHLSKRAAQLGTQTRQIAETIRATHPDVDAALLREIYFDEAAVAAERLAALRALRFAPFTGLPAEPAADAPR